MPSVGIPSACPLISSLSSRSMKNRTANDADTLDCKNEFNCLARPTAANHVLLVR